MIYAPSHDDPNWLASRVLERFNLTHKLYYVSLAPDLTVIQASTNLSEILENPVSTVEGCSVDELFLELIGAEEMLSEILSGKLPALSLREVNRIQSNGSTRYLDFQVLPRDTNNPGEGLLLTIEDTSSSSRLEQQLVQERNELKLTQAQLKRANEELAHLNRQKSLFLSIAAHDLRTPLTVIQGYADLLLSELPSDESGRDTDFYVGLSTIVNQGNVLNRLVSDLLDLDQVEQGKLAIYPVCCDLNLLAREAAVTLTTSAQQKRQMLSVHLASEAVQVRADRERLRQILYNLVNNALKYTPEGGHVEIATWHDQQGGVLSVKDNGRGIPQAEVGCLYQLYYRTEEAKHSQEHGAGLGLYIVKMLVEAQSGQIDVTSQPGQGTEFLVHLPNFYQD